MAVFMINICTFDDCGLTFPRLDELIYHIEYKHINRDPLVLEQKEASQPASVAFSHVVRFASEASIREYVSSVKRPDARASSSVEPSSLTSTNTTEKNPCKPYYKKPGRVQPKHFDFKKYLEANNIEIGSEFEDDVLTPSEDSNDSWTTVEEYSSDYILRYGSRMNMSGLCGAVGPATASAAATDKPFACPVPGCKKRYKNINGIKYHSKNGHKKDGKVKKGYKCHCGKSYKTEHRLRKHTTDVHTVDGGAFARTVRGVVVASVCTHQLACPPVAALHPARAAAPSQ